MAAIVASKVKRIRKQRDADSQQNLRNAVGNSQAREIRGRGGDQEFENNGDISPSSILDKRTLIHRQVNQSYVGQYLPNDSNLYLKCDRICG